jgi:hypothetical protein
VDALPSVRTYALHVFQLMPLATVFSSFACEAFEMVQKYFYIALTILHR